MRDRKYVNRLKDLREDRDLTQREVADAFYLQPTQYRRYENGESDLPLEWAKKFAKYYGVSIDYIAGRASFGGERPELGLTERQMRLVAAYEKNPHMQDAVDKLLGI